MEISSQIILVLTTFPDVDKARETADLLLAQKLVACCTLVSGSSLYLWQQKRCEGNEVVMLIKTRSDLYADLEKKLKEIHPYEVPEIIALPAVAVSQSYLEWIKEVTRD